MPTPTDDDLQSATKDLVELARKNGNLEHYTRAFVREQLEKKFDVPSGSLKKRKRVINEAIAAAMANDEGGAAEADASPDADVEVKTKGKAKKEANEAEEKDDDAEPSGEKKKKKRASKGASLPTSNTKAKRADKNTDAFLSMVGLGPGSSGEAAAAQLLTGLGGGLANGDDDRSDTELSVLIDEPVRAKKGRKKSTDDKSKKSKKRKSDASAQATESEAEAEGDKPKKKRVKKEKSDKPMDKNEEEIKRLKSFVVACGVRKKWAKEFEGLDKPSQQINKLKQILGELGMMGRLSLEKAKSIREQREFAQEMEDIQEFNSKVNGPRTSRSKRSSRGDAEPEDDKMEEDGSESPGPSRGKMKRPNNSVLAFLADQSESD